MLFFRKLSLRKQTALNGHCELNTSVQKLCRIHRTVCNKHMLTGMKSDHLTQILRGFQCIQLDGMNHVCFNYCT